MSSQINFFLNQALQYLRSGNLSGAELLLRQIIKARPNHSEALRLQSVIYSQKGENNLALETIQRAITGDKRNAIAYSNQGNILLNLGMLTEALASYQKAISLSPNYAEAYSNLGNAFQDLGEVGRAIELYKKAISIDARNPEFFFNLGNACWKSDLMAEARKSYERTVSIVPGHVDALHNLAHLDLHEFNFTEGWHRYEYRWHIAKDKPTLLNTSKPRWDGLPRNNRLFIWAEQGIGDQILHGSILRDLEKYPQTKIISIDKKLVSIFRRSFPSFRILDKDQQFPEELYDEQLPIGSLGQIFRPSISSFVGRQFPYLSTNPTLDSGIKTLLAPVNKALCGISWKSGRAKLGINKTIPFGELAPIFSLKTTEFINLQYGEVNEEILQTNKIIENPIKILPNIDLYEDIDSLLSAINLCNIVVTSSNSTAHIAGALGKETLLILPIGNAKFWYWHDIDGISLWYPSVRIFKQEIQGDWSAPIQAIKSYLEKKFKDYQ